MAYCTPLKKEEEKVTSTNVALLLACSFGSIKLYAGRVGKTLQAWKEVASEELKKSPTIQQDYDTSIRAVFQIKESRDK